MGGRLSGTALNFYQASYSAQKGGSLKIGKIASTMMAGPPEAMAVEKAYFAALEKTAAYASDGKTLRLYDDRGKLLLVFRNTPATLDGTWRVTGYNNGDQAVVSVIGTSTVTMDFGHGGELSGKGGVNSYSAKYTTRSGGVISITSLSATEMAGPKDLMRQEKLFLDALEASTRYELQGSQLVLRDASGAMQVQAIR
jgi:heat shock protein HslJ